MKKIFLSIGCLFICLQYSVGQKSNAPSKPKLIVGIVVDQMRYDFLWRFWDQYGDGGFKRLVNDGFLCRDARYNYFLTTTAPGHSTIYTGTTPALHGIVDNNWYDRETGQVIYAVTDSTAKSIGNETTNVSSSPYRLLTSTVTDELKLASRDSKVIGIAIKDRSAIMPAGHLSNGSFWFDSRTGNWITSSWYMQHLPDWLEQFNKSKKSDNYLINDWKLLLPRNQYTQCTNDTVPYENPLAGESLPIFPHKLTKGNYSMIPYTPFGNTMTKDVAIEAVKGEKLGKRDVTDFLCISFSSTDMIGHTFGPNSLETADCYMRLDRDIEALLKFLDEYIGKDNVLVFLTADHGVALNPQFAHDEHLSGGILQADSLSEKLNQYIASFYGPGKWISAMMDQQVYLNKKFIASGNTTEEQVAEKVANFLSMQKGVLCVLAPRYHINTCAPYVENNMMNGFQPARSGDILYSLAPGWIDWILPKGSSHGTTYAYDNHVPLIWYGWKIGHGTSADPVVIPDIAPTISNWLNVAFPSGCTGKPIIGIIMK